MLLLLYPFSPIRIYARLIAGRTPGGGAGPPLNIIERGGGDINYIDSFYTYKKIKDEF